MSTYPGDEHFDYERDRRERSLVKCARCGRTRREHCDMDEPGLDHANGCNKPHHEFTSRPTHVE